MQLTPVFLPGESHAQRSLAATVHTVAKSQTQLSHYHTHAYTHTDSCMCGLHLGPQEEPLFRMPYLIEVEMERKEGPGSNTTDSLFLASFSKFS